MWFRATRAGRLAALEICLGSGRRVRSGSGFQPRTPRLGQGSADRDGICLGDDEHDQSMGGRVSISKLIPVTQMQ